MHNEAEAYAASELEQVAHCFDHWRHTRTHRAAPIPPPLWHQAITLTTKLPLLLVAKRLGLKSTTLKQRCAVPYGGPTPEASLTALGFVDVTPSPPWTVPTQATEVELQRADGTRLRITSHAPQFPVTALIRTFLEAR
jgi:hypothetical protein